MLNYEKAIKDPENHFLNSLDVAKSKENFVGLSCESGKTGFNTFLKEMD
jgi:hypothetical protein